MTEWCLAHPWMTFFLLTFALLVIDEIVCAIANALASKNRDKHEEGQA